MIHNGGWRGGIEFFSRLSHRKLQTELGGTPIWQREWDVLIVLDACRYDLMESVRSEYEFIISVDSLRSVGSNSKVWMERTFSSEFGDEMQRTGYVTANPFSEYLLDESQLGLLEEVWRYGWDTELETIPPRPVTDTAITIGREDDWDRLVVHYMQPHVPFIDSPSPNTTYPSVDRERIEQIGDGWNKPLHQLQRKEVTREEFWSRYQSTLRLALDDIGLLLRNLDAETVAISADHGNALGERWLYGHPSGVDLPCLRRVPWSTTTAEDRGEYCPSEYEREVESDIEEQLSALGYYS